MTDFSQFQDKIVWILVEPGLRGTENQCIALAECLKIGKVVHKYVTMKPPWRQLAPFLMIGKEQAYENAAQLFKAPFPDIIIASGRKSVLAALHIKKLSGNKSFLIQIQDPKLPACFFDLVIAPRHDGLSGKNVISTLGALHRISPEFLKENFSPQFEDAKSLPAPRIAVLIGGTTTKTKFSTEKAENLALRLQILQNDTGASLMVTTSRRTGLGQTRILERALAGEQTLFWDGQGSNPYYDYLYLADAIVVTNDSVSMASEALATGKPVFVADIGRQGRRIERFHKMLSDNSMTKPLGNTLEDWNRPPGNDMIETCQKTAQYYKTFLEGMQNAGKQT